MSRATTSKPPTDERTRTDSVEDRLLTMLTEKVKQLKASIYFAEPNDYLIIRKPVSEMVLEYLEEGSNIHHDWYVMVKKTCYDTLPDGSISHFYEKIICYEVWGEQDHLTALKSLVEIDDYNPQIGYEPDLNDCDCDHEMHIVTRDEFYRWLEHNTKFARESENISI